MRLMAAGIVTELIPVLESEVMMAIEDATRQRLLFAIVVTEQNEIHRSITVNILHGMAQGMMMFAHFLFLTIYVKTCRRILELKVKSCILVLWIWRKLLIGCQEK